MFSYKQESKENAPVVQKYNGRLTDYVHTRRAHIYKTSEVMRMCRYYFKLHEYDIGRIKWA